MAISQQTTINQLLMPGSSSGILTFLAPATVTSYTMIWPSSQGTGFIQNDGSGNLSFASATTATAFLNLFTSSLQGLVPGSGGGTANFLRADGTWAAPTATGTSTPTANAAAAWDANLNLSANSFISGFTTTATASGITSLTVSSTYIQIFTGSSPQTVNLPDVATIVNGQEYLIQNTGTGTLTIKPNGGTTITTLGGKVAAIFTCVNKGVGNLASAWTWRFMPTAQNFLPITAGGTGVQAVPSSATASAFAAWRNDSSFASAYFVSTITSTATAGGTTTLTAASTPYQVFTGSSNQTVKMPVVSSLDNTREWYIINNSTGILTVQTSAGTTLNSVPPNYTLTATVIDSTAGTGTASWGWELIASGANSGINGPVTFTVTAGTSLTAGQAIYVASSSDTGNTAGQAYPLDASNPNRIEFAGIVTANATSGTTATIQVDGRITGLSGLTTGQPVFASVSTPGGFQTTAPTANGQYIIQVGMADSATSMIVNGGLSSTAALITTANTPSAVLGIKNYILYGTFENNSTTGWSLFNTTLTSLIPTGAISAGATSLTMATTSSALSGSFSLQLTASSAWTAGQGFISDAFSVDASDQAKVLKFSFSYKVLSGTFNLSGTSSNTLAIYVYDVTNSAWIQPAGVYNMVQSTGVGIAQGTFQTSSNGTSYRIAIVAINTTGGAVQMSFDNYFVGPQFTVYGAAITDWTKSGTTTISAITTGPAKGTTATDEMWWRRVGNTMEIRIAYRQTTAGTLGSGDYLFSIPSGFSIDTTALTVSTSSSASPTPNLTDNSVGTFVTADSTNSQALTGNVVVYNTSSVRLIGGLFASTSSNPFTVGSTSGWGLNRSANLSITAVFSVPISGWSSTLQMSNDTDTRVVAVHATINAITSITSGSPILYNVALFDTHASYSTSTGAYTVPVAGIYKVAIADHVLRTNVSCTFNLQKNSVFYTTLAQTADNTNTSQGDSLVQCNAGDTLRIVPTGTTSIDYNVGTNVPSFTIHRLSGPAVVAASEKIYLQYTGNAGTALTANVTNIDWSTKVVDSHGAWSGTTFTAPRSGWYTVQSQSNITANTVYDLVLYVNAVAKLTQVATPGSTNGRSIGMFGIYLNAGDALTIRSDVSVTLLNSATQHWISISSQG